MVVMFVGVSSGGKVLMVVAVFNIGPMNVIVGMLLLDHHGRSNIRSIPTSGEHNGGGKQDVFFHRKQCTGARKAPVRPVGSFAGISHKT